MFKGSKMNINSQAKNKAIKILIIALTIMIIGCFAGYFGYGATMVNPNSEKSIINYLSVNKNQSVNIIKTKKYNNYFAVLYTDPSEIEINKNSAHLIYFSKSKYYSNRYQEKAKTGGKQTDPIVMYLVVDDESDNNNNNEVSCFIGNIATNETKCSIFELGDDYLPIRKIDEIEVQKNEPYILVKKYKLSNSNHDIVCYDGSIPLSFFCGG